MEAERSAHLTLLDSTITVISGESQNSEVTH
jgi:hypothetical protein